jgi:hypothetical protein
MLRPGRLRWPVLIVVDLLLLGLLLWRPTMERPIDPHDVRPETGRAYQVDVRTLVWPGYRLLGDSGEQPTRSRLIVLRDGRPLGPGHAVHDVIRREGNGAFSHWGDGLYFSTPDHTDPRSDGRSYSIRGPAALSPWAAGVVSIVLIIAGWASLRSAGLLPSVRGRPRARAFVPGRSAAAASTMPLKLVAVAVVLATAPWAWSAAVAREAGVSIAAGRWGWLALYLAIVAVCITGLLVVPLLRDGRIRTALSALFLLGFLLDQIIVAVSGQHTTADMMQTLWRERTEAGGAFSTYADTVVSKGMLVAMLAAAFLLPPARRWALRSRWAMVPIVALGSVMAVVFVGRGATEALPSPYAVPAQLAMVVRAGPSHDVDRPPVEYARALRPMFKKIVMIVDESVRGDYLGINDPKYDNTPALRGARDIVANYGVAISATNCSAATRLILRIGLRKSQLPDTRGMWRHQPTIWQYAHKAGYTTAQIDTFEQQPHSYMEAPEARMIDLRLLANTGRAHTRDPIVADMLIDLLKRDEPMFIYVNKFGTHPAYSYGAPPDFAYDPSPLVATLSLDESRRRSVRDYHRALRWMVDGFFERTLPALRRSDVVVLYTSDHGQSLYEGGYDLSHCSMTSSVHRGEVRVPLFVITASPTLGPQFRAAAERAFDRASHFEVFPTLLELMGYSRDWVERVYGPSLLDVPRDRTREFLLGTFEQSTAMWLSAE